MFINAVSSEGFNPDDMMAVTSACDVVDVDVDVVVDANSRVDVNVVLDLEGTRTCI